MLLDGRLQKNIENHIFQIQNDRKVISGRSGGVPAPQNDFLIWFLPIFYFGILYFWIAERIFGLLDRLSRMRISKSQRN